MPQIAKAMAAGAVTADAMDGDNKISLDKGIVTVVDNQVDQTTGTIKMKAEFPNSALQLWPGQFVNVRILANTLQQVVVIPTPAIQRGPNGAYVFVAADNRVAQRPVTVGQQNDTQSVALSGVAAGDKVVTTGFGRLQDGARIIASPTGGGGGAGGEKRPTAATEPAASGATAVSTAAPAAVPADGAERANRGDGKRRGDGEGKRPPGTAEARSGSQRPASTPQ